MEDNDFPSSLQRSLGRRTRQFELRNRVVSDKKGLTDDQYQALYGTRENREIKQEPKGKRRSKRSAAADEPADKDDDASADESDEGGTETEAGGDRPSAINEQFQAVNRRISARVETEPERSPAPSRTVVRRGRPRKPENLRSRNEIEQELKRKRESGLEVEDLPELPSQGVPSSAPDSPSSLASSTPGGLRRGRPRKPENWRSSNELEQELRDKSAEPAAKRARFSDPQDSAVKVSFDDTQDADEFYEAPEYTDDARADAGTPRRGKGKAPPGREFDHSDSMESSMFYRRPRMGWDPQMEQVLMKILRKFEYPSWIRIVQIVESSNENHNPDYQCLKGMSQVQLKDKARAIKHRYIRESVAIPKCFRHVTVSKKYAPLGEQGLRYEE
ncbi:uncharacterized protein V1510DRAFT_104360 [Dipodascopsis tothii]|uniref:uncharacterized protein n=1 Tax=Dipodascopsis tothii TaxID=44089 RepID=UPI0034CD3FA4